MLRVYFFVILILMVPLVDTSKAESVSIDYNFVSPNETTMTLISTMSGYESKQIRSGIDEVYGNDNDEVEALELEEFEYEMRNSMIEAGGSSVVGSIVPYDHHPTDYKLEDVSFTTTGVLGPVDSDQIVTYNMVYDFSFDIDSDLNGYIYLQSWDESSMEVAIMTYTVPEGYEIVEVLGFENDFVGNSGRSINSKVTGDIWIKFEKPFVNVLGCKYSNAENYNPEATDDDGSCKFSKDSTGFEAIIISSLLIIVAILNRRTIG